MFLPNNNINPEIRTFLENLLTDAGMELTDEIKESMIQDLYGRLEKKLIADALDHMQPQQVEEFIKLMQSGGQQQQMESYINTHIPNSKEVFAKSLMDFRNYFLQGTTKANDQTSV